MIEILVNYPTKCQENVFEGSPFFGETLRGKTFYRKNKEHKNKFSPKQILTISPLSS